MNTEGMHMARLCERAARDQYEAALQDFLACEDEYQRWRLLDPLLRHRPTDADWDRFEDLRTEWQHARDEDLTSRDIAQMAGLSVAEIQQMVRRGEMPAPRHQGRWHWWWNRGEITAWLAQRNLE